MKFNLADTTEAQKAFVYLVQLTDKKVMAEVKKLSPKRSLNQNNYLHLILSAFGMHFGYTLNEAKLVYKDLNSTIYKYEKKGRNFVRSSAELTKDEMTKSIDVFRQASAEAGYDLPLATNQEWLREIENEIERSKYL